MRPYRVETIDGKDYVSIYDAKRILGAQSAADLRALGSATIKIGARKTLWSLGWIIDQARRLHDSNQYSPDVTWIEEYEKNRAEIASKRTAKGVPIRSFRSRASSPGDSLRITELRQLMPPPSQVPSRDVDWKAVERVIGVTYPRSFKSFIAVYGALEWFDWLQPLIPCENETPEHFSKYLDAIFRDNLTGDIIDTGGRLLLVPEFGTPGGWLPFMVGSDGEVYCWLTDGAPEAWCIICVVNRTATILPPAPISDMLVGWLKGESAMKAIWGSVEEFRKHSPERLSMLR